MQWDEAVPVIHVGIAYPADRPVAYPEFECVLAPFLFIDIGASRQF